MGDSGQRNNMASGQQSFTFTSAPHQQKNYVFVDEKNRHRRLKVVRACHGCRKRKIKCDAANTNTWPCSACVRLKMTCIPPSLNSFDQDDSFDLDSNDSSSNLGFQQATPRTSVEAQQQSSPDPIPPQGGAYPFSDSRSTLVQQNAVPSSQPFFPATQPYDPLSYIPTDTISLNNVSGSDYPDLSTIPNVQPSQLQDSDWRSETSEAGIDEALGDLKISDVAIAPYMVSRKGAEAPAVEEDEVQLPKETGTDKIVRIPQVMMPSDEDALQSFSYFFKHIHPYVPVLYPPQFYEQWQTNRASISPLILEAIFAIVAQMRGDAQDSQRWLALASRHEASFKDVPRLSTLQGFLLLLKAREANPKSTYYYNSWMTIVTIVTMAKELGLDEHLETHRNHQDCGSLLYDCIVRSRVWHTLFVVELMIGGPQGRTNLAVDMETVDFDGIYFPEGRDDQEMRVSQQFTFFMRAIRNVRETARVYIKLRKQKTDWALDQDFLKLDSLFENWEKELPTHLQLTYPADGSPPFIPFHFVAHLHCYHRLSILMQQRPQLQQSASRAMSDSWKQKMMSCYTAAKEMCRLQEAILDNFEIQGMQAMQRGIGFSIYAILTCTMVHLIALTSPVPEINLDSSDYFTRHMRILERCTQYWPMEEVRKQVDSLREAFSADLSRPFELRTNFPGSPARSEAAHSPQFSFNSYPPQQSFQTFSEDPAATYAPITPPRSAAAMRQTSPDYTNESLLMMGSGQNQFNNDLGNITPVEPQQVYWNPSKLFQQWDAAFGMAATTPPTNNQYSPSPPGNNPMPFPSPSSFPDSQPQYNAGFTTAGPAMNMQNPYITHNTMAPPQQTYAISMPQTTMSTNPYQTNPTTQQQYMPPSRPQPQGFVTPSMWQEAYLSAGLKRRYNDTSDMMGQMGHESKRQR